MGRKAWTDRAISIAIVVGCLAMGVQVAMNFSVWQQTHIIEPADARLIDPLADYVDEWRDGVPYWRGHIPLAEFLGEPALPEGGPECALQHVEFRGSGILGVSVMVTTDTQGTWHTVEPCMVEVVAEPGEEGQAR